MKGVEEATSPENRLIDGVLETALYSDDLPAMSDFYGRLLGMKRLFGDERLLAFEAGPRGVLLLFRRGTTRESVRLPHGTIPPHDGHGPIHIAFAVSAGNLAEIERLLGENDVPVEGHAHWPRGGRSVYVRDPGGHLVEFATPGLWPNY